MRVLMVTSSYPKFEGDVTAPFIESIARSVVDRGHAVDVVLPHHPDLRRPSSDPVRFFEYRYAPMRALNLWGYAQSLERDVRVKKRVRFVAPLVALSLRRTVAARLRAERYDVVHLHWVVPNAAMLSDLVARCRVPQVVSLHGSDVSVAERGGLAGALARAAFGRAGSVTACSGDLARRALALGSPQARTRTVPYGVDTDVFAPNRADASLRAAWGVPDGATLVVALGRLVEKKGFAHLLDAAARTSGVFVALVGEGDLRGELQSQIDAKRVPARLVGALPREKTAAALATADIVAVPSVVDRSGNVDGLPNALLEALACGRAVVASRVAGIPDVIEDGATAILTPPGDVDALAQALARLRDDKMTRARLGEAARQLATSRLTWKAAAAAFEECYALAQTPHAR